MTSAAAGERGRHRKTVESHCGRELKNDIILWSDVSRALSRYQQFPSTEKSETDGPDSGAANSTQWVSAKTEAGRIAFFPRPSDAEIERGLERACGNRSHQRRNNEARKKARTVLSRRGNNGTMVAAQAYLSNYLDSAFFVPACRLIPRRLTTFYEKSIVPRGQKRRRQEPPAAWTRRAETHPGSARWQRGINDQADQWLIESKGPGCTLRNFSSRRRNDARGTRRRKWRWLRHVAWVLGAKIFLLVTGLMIFFFGSGAGQSHCSAGLLVSRLERDDRRQG